MHDSAMLNGKRFFDVYVAPMKSAIVVDIGAQDVNGSLRSVAPDHVKYIGVDFVRGRGVDCVLEDPYILPFESSSVDVVVSTSCFEHSEMFWLLFLEILRVLKPSGLFYLNAPSNGWFHRFPVDCWRFYPDSGRALVKWARRNGLRPVLLEAYTTNQIEDVWNDYVCVFGKDEQMVHIHPARILPGLRDFTNGVLHPDLETFIEPQIVPQDQRVLGWRIHSRLRRWVRRFS